MENKYNYRFETLAGARARQTVECLGHRHKVYLANEKYNCARPYVFWFGECAPTYVCAFAGSFEEAFGTAADFAVEHFPEYDATERVDEAYREALAEIEAAGGDPDSETAQYDAGEAAMVDVTPLDGGKYLLSWEWGVCLECADPGAFKRFLAE